MATRNWGVEITRVEVKDIVPSPDIIKAMELVGWYQHDPSLPSSPNLTDPTTTARAKQMSAERHKRATVLDSEASAVSAINEANAMAATVRTRAEAEKGQSGRSAHHHHPPTDQLTLFHRPTPLIQMRWSWRQKQLNKKSSSRLMA